MQPLPIDPHLPAVVDALRRRGALVLAADPGSGKTTRVPPAILEAGLAGDGEIVVLEPRRLAARMAARRVAFERGERVGETIGYQVRFEDVTSRRTRIRFVTEGILARRLVGDPELRGVGVVVLDELHERHIQSDLALALLVRLRRTARPDLRLVAMSATLDAGPVAELLGAASLRVEAPRYDVAIEPLARPDDRPLAGQVASAVRHLAAPRPPGHILVFLPGAAEIRRAAEACEAVATEAGLDVVPLHGDLSAEAQDRAVVPSERPKLILSTNVAESSVTIEGVAAVVDSGLARIARHSPWSGLPSLDVGKISRASAAQRAGRAGRTGPGRCLRLYTAHDHDTRPAFDLPEILRSDLAEPLLALHAAGVADPSSLAWLDAPPEGALRAAEELLRRLGAIDVDGAMTTLGRRMSELPLHPRLARLILEAAERGAPRSGALAAALLSEREIRESARTRFEGRGKGADSSGPSDLLARMEAFEGVESSGGLRPERIRAHGLDVAATLSAARARDQLLGLVGGRGRAGDVEEAILLATLAGFPDRVARRRSPRSPELVFAGGGGARLAETSVVLDGELLVALDAEERRGEGARVRLASRVEPEWLPELFPDRLVDRREMVFDRRLERVEETTSLSYDGLVLEERRRPASGPEATALLASEAAAAGAESFAEPGELERFRARAAFAAGCGAPIEPVDDDAVLAALGELAAGSRSFAEMKKTGLLTLLRSRLGSRGAAELDRFAPERIALPGGRSVRVDYDPSRPPSIASRLQDFFGQREGPRIGGGKVPLVLRLLAPNQREVQVTSDLAGFWERHYPALRRELGRRYPRHSWPEDPLAASPPGRRTER